MYTVDVTKHVNSLLVWQGQWVDSEKKAPEIATWLRSTVGPQKRVIVKSDKIVVRGKGWKLLREFGSDKVVLFLNDSSHAVMARLLWS